MPLVRRGIQFGTTHAQTRIAAHSHQADCTTLVPFTVVVPCSTLLVNIIVHWKDVMLGSMHGNAILRHITFTKAGLQHIFPILLNSLL